MSRLQSRQSKDKRSSDNQFKIAIVSQPPTNVYSDEWFSVRLDLSSSFTPDVPVQFVDLCANLHRVVDGNVLPEPAQDNNVVDLHLAHQSLSDSLSLGNHSSFAVKCKIKSPLAEDEESVKYCLKFYQRSKETGSVLKMVEQALSTPVQIVKYKLSIHHKWDSNIFYKDEGGKEKCLRLTVRLSSGEGIIKGMHLPLKLRLVYDDSESNPVLKQEETFKILGNTKQFIDPENGEATIKFRFEDVSKNHQGLAFKLEISPDARRLSEIAPILTPGIIVRSKRNKRQSSPSRRKFSPGQYTTSLGGMYHQSSSVEEDSNEQVWDVNRRDIGPREALAQVMAWSKETTKVLPSLKWNLIGYCQHGDGSADYSKPNYSMPYPNVCLSRILDDYAETARCFQVLRNAIESSAVQEKHIPHNHVRRELEASRRGNPQQFHPGSYFSGHDGYDYGPPQSPFNPTPVTPQNHLFGNGPMTSPSQLHSSSLHGPMNESDQRKKQRREDVVVTVNSNLSQKKETVKPSDDQDLTKDVEYILAKHFEKLGFPVYNVRKEVIGFYREAANEIGVGRFIPLSQHETEISVRQKEEATRVLEDAMAKKSPALQSIKDWGSINGMFDHAMVYDWSKDFGHT